MGGSRKLVNESPRVVGGGVLSDIHAKNAQLPIRRPDQCGAFPTWWIEGLFGESLLVVPDANVLRNDIVRACRKNQRTVLITAANAGSLRLFCAEHVLEEVSRHAKEWANQTDIPHQTYVARWTDEYLPLIRTVDANGLPLSILSPIELERVASLGDSKDVPSVVLSLALGAFFLTEDRRAWEAVYGTGANNEELRKWLSVLMDGGDAGELGKLVFVTTALPTAGIISLWKLSRWVFQQSPWTFAALGAGLFLLAAQTSRETYRRIGSGLTEAISGLNEHLYSPYHEALERFRRMAPDIPSWEVLRGTNDRRAILARASAYHLARSRTGAISAHELARALPDVGIGQGTQLVRETLQNHGCFHQPYAGRWQVGNPYGHPK